MSLDINRADLTVGIVGTGAMGRGIAQVTAQGGIKAIMFDAAPGGAAKAKAAILETLKGLVAKGRLEECERDAAVSRLTATDHLGRLADCDLVIESVVEDLATTDTLPR